MIAADGGDLEMTATLERDLGMTAADRGNSGTTAADGGHIEGTRSGADAVPAVILAAAGRHRHQYQDSYSQ